MGGLIPYTAKSNLFRNKIAKPLTEQLLPEYHPRKVGWNDACHLPDQGQVLPVSGIQI
jgi:hypothetical protein